MKRERQIYNALMRVKDDRNRFGVWCEVWGPRPPGGCADWLGDHVTGERYEFETLDAATRFALAVARIVDEASCSNPFQKTGFSGSRFTARKLEE
jgi:hypothetical protein